jgi:hypothetical protein
MLFISFVSWFLRGLFGVKMGLGMFCVAYGFFDVDT